MSLRTNDPQQDLRTVLGVLLEDCVLYNSRDEMFTPLTPYLFNPLDQFRSVPPLSVGSSDDGETPRHK